MTAGETFEIAAGFIRAWEGGYVNHPADPGGATNFGISLRFLRGLPLDVADINRDGDLDAEDIRDLTPETAKPFYCRYFWEPMRLDKVCLYAKPALAVAAMDTAFNMGPGTARRLVQRAVGTAADGIWGEKTWAAIAKCDDGAAAEALCNLRLVRYSQLAAKNRDMLVFLKGWTNRMNALSVLCAKTAGRHE